MSEGTRRCMMVNVRVSLVLCSSFPPSLTLFDPALPSCPLRRVYRAYCDAPLDPLKPSGPQHACRETRKKSIQTGGYWPYGEYLESVLSPFTFRFPSSYFRHIPRHGSYTYIFPPVHYPPSRSSAPPPVASLAASHSILVVRSRLAFLFFALSPALFISFTSLYSVSCSSSLVLHHHG